MFFLQNIGLTIHPIKSSFLPSQEIIFLGVITNTKNMTITLTNEKSLKYMNIQNVPYSYSPIRKVAKFLGNLVASFAAVTCGRLFYRFIEIDKINVLKLSKGRFALYLHLVYYILLPRMTFVEPKYPRLL